jgi:predicted membrane protein
MIIDDFGSETPIAPPRSDVACTIIGRLRQSRSADKNRIDEHITIISVVFLQLGPYWHVHFHVVISLKIGRISWRNRNSRYYTFRQIL